MAGYNLYYGQASGQYLGSLSVPFGSSYTFNGLAEGVTHYFAVRAYDSSLLESDYSAEIAMLIPFPVTVVRQGLGTVFTQAIIADDLSQTNYTVVAAASPGMVFAGWTGSLMSSATTLNFVWLSNVVLQANFVPSPYPAAQGVYNGLFTDTNQVALANSGSFSLTVTRRGTYSGRLQIGARRFPFSGRLDAQCHATSVISGPDDASLSLSLSLGLGANAGQISGSLTDGDWIANLDGERAVFNSATDPAPPAGTYTVAFPGTGGDPLLPAGDGFGTVRLFRDGLTVFAGTLADGEKVTQSATVSRTSRWPMYLPLYRGNGALFGWPSFTNLITGAEFGQVTWIKLANPVARYYPNGFTNQSGALASVFRPPTAPGGRVLALTNAIATFSGGNLLSDFTNSIALASHGHASSLSSVAAFNLAISPGSGIFHGAVADPSTNRRFPISGVALQNLDAAFGFFLGTNQSSRVLITVPGP